ncbi:MAG: hypothetical protein KBF43_15090, partial [Dermatophilaceae bacterium]|nr:hypothetical protein [Dermatophilaceae bacterium]
MFEQHDEPPGVIDSKLERSRLRLRENGFFERAKLLTLDEHLDFSATGHVDAELKNAIVGGHLATAPVRSVDGAVVCGGGRWGPVG